MKRQIIILLLVTISISSIGQISVTVTGTDEACGYANGTATATVSGNCPSGFTYIWNSTPPQVTATATNLPAGIYTVTVYCDADSATASVTITNIPGPSCTICNIQNDTNGQGTGSITVWITGGTPPYSIVWNTVPSQSGPTATNLPAGTYTVTVVDQNACTCTTLGIVDNITSIDETNNSINISPFPNPTKGFFSMDFSNLNESDFSIELSDIIGKIIYTKKTTDKIMTFDISALPKGFYYLIIYNRQIILNKKILKE